MSKHFRIALLLLIISGNLIAQLSKPGTPESFLLRLKKEQLPPVKTLNLIDTSFYIREDRETGISNRYGIVQQLDIDIRKEGIATDIPDKGTIWQYELKSPLTFSLGLFFKNFHLPEGASLFIYDEAHSRVAGAFTSLNNWETKELPIAEFPGNNVIIEYFEPLNPEFQGELVIGRAVQSYRSLFQVNTDRIQINCPEGADWQDAKHAVCLMTFSDINYSYQCTGFLVNNIRADGTPFFQTANHCLSTNALASSLVTYFNYENSTCTSNDAYFSQSLAGATVKASSNYTDFTLLLLNEYAPYKYNPYYSGWDASNSSPVSGTTIHHPSGTPKCISIDANAPSTYPYSIGWQENSTYTNTTAPNTHWEVNFTSGTIESGSSGSPLFNENQLAIGQLHGGTATDDFYGKMSLSWNYSTDTTKQIKHWLDPDNTGSKTITGSYLRFKPVSRFSLNYVNVCTNTAVQLSDHSNFQPDHWKWVIKPSTYIFSGGTTSTSQNPKVIFTANGKYTISLITDNIYGVDTLTKINCIQAGNLEVSFTGLPSSPVICGYNISNYTLTPYGADHFSFYFSGTDTSLSFTDVTKVSLSNIPATKLNRSFNLWVILKGTQGTCTAYDSVLLQIAMPSNDNFENAVKLYPGRNTSYSNFCASIQTDEPSPPTTSCYGTQSWCPAASLKDSVISHTIWFTFLGPPNGFITIDTHGFADKIAVYQADDPSKIMSGYAPGYKIVAASEGRTPSDLTSILDNIKVDPYKTYWLQLDGHRKTTGTVTIDLLTNSIEVSPNPSSGIFNISILGKSEGTANVKIFSLYGKLLYSESFAVTLDSNKFSFDLSTLPEGIYIMQSEINGDKSVAKLMRVN